MIAVKRSGPCAPRFEMLNVAPSVSSRFSRPLRPRSTQSCATARNLDEAQLLDIVKHRHQQAVVDRNHQTNMRAARRHDVGVGRSGSPENMAFKAGNSISVRATACSRKSFTDSLGEPAGGRAENSPRNACISVQSTERATVNCGMVALLNVMARASARRIGDSGCAADDGWSATRGAIERSLHILQLNPPARSGAGDRAKIDAAFGSEFAGTGRAADAFAVRARRRSRRSDARAAARAAVLRLAARGAAAAAPAPCASADSIQAT